MPTWPEIREYARSKYDLKHDDDSGFSIVVTLDGGRSQLVGIHHFVARERSWISFRSYVCPMASLPLEKALRKNAELLVGALALDEDDEYCLVYSAQLDTMDEEEFEIPLAEIARAADRLEAKYAGGDEH